MGLDEFENMLHVIPLKFRFKRNRPPKFEFNLKVPPKVLIAKNLQKT